MCGGENGEVYMRTNFDRFSEPMPLEYKNKLQSEPEPDRQWCYNCDRLVVPNRDRCPDCGCPLEE